MPNVTGSLDGRAIARRLPVDAKAVANLFLDWAQADATSISPMKLQKMIFFCHADFLVQFGAPLVIESFEAWDHGPVIPSIYQEFKKHKDGPISSRARSFNPITATSTAAAVTLPTEIERKLHELYDFYKELDAIALSHLSHAAGGPWRHARSMFANGLNADRRIESDMIVRFHRLLHA